MTRMSVPADIQVSLGQQIAAFLRQRYPKNAAKLIATEFDVSIATAERWLAGVHLSAKHIAQMQAKWGEPFTRAAVPGTFAAADAHAATLAAELEAARKARDAAELEGQRRRAEEAPHSGWTLYSSRRDDAGVHLAPLTFFDSMPPKRGRGAGFLGWLRSRL